MLGHSQIAHYLLSLGLLKPRAIVEDGLTVVDASRRNCVFIATTRSGPTYVIKQASPRSALTLEHEAEVLRMLADAPELTVQAPTVVHEDRAMALLVLRSPCGGRDWREHHKAGRFPVAPARTLGRSLAALHRHAPDGIGDQPADAERMWALQFAEPPLELIRDLSAGAQDLVARLQTNPEMMHRLTRLREHDHPDAFVHGDLRWDNCLAIAAPARGEGRERSSSTGNSPVGEKPLWTSARCSRSTSVRGSDRSRSWNWQLLVDFCPSRDTRCDVCSLRSMRSGRLIARQVRHPRSSGGSWNWQPYAS